MNENEKHERAFEAYYAQGPKRSLSKVADELGVSRSAVKNWSRAFGWAERTAERDKAIATAAADRSIQVGVESTLRNRQIVQMGLVQIARQIAEGTVRATISDLDRLIRLEAFLEGKADSRQEIIARDLAGKSTDELRVMLQDEIAELADLADGDGDPH
jgi:transposase